ncbi:MAG TPA: type II toxin-antitoxin system Phd/YefM family antitoxin [Candidatus Baltobacteraceae bacterium]|jgi:prevent-host-death family protein|nr:type II toxin-antitoxin system Phd/YefM family antitoxin [Candidatus Baltobacteraceae bacterium]
MTSKTWTLTDAKARFSAVVQLALEGAPQRVVRNGREAVIVVAQGAFEAATRPKRSLVDLFEPIRGTEIDAGSRHEPDREAPAF